MATDNLARWDRSVLADRIADGAQNIIDDLEQVDALTDALYAEVRQAHSHKLAVRSARGMVWEVFFHLVAIRLIENVLPVVRGGGSLLPERGMLDRPLPQGCERFNDPLYRPFIAAFDLLHQRAIDAVLHEVRTEPRYRGLYAQLERRQREFGGDMASMMDQRGFDLEIVLELLVSRQRACPHHPSGQELADMVVGDMDVLLRGASLSRRSLRRIMPRPAVRPTDPQSTCPHDEQTRASNDTFAGYEHVLVEDQHPHCTWQTPKLQAGPPRPKGFCAGQPPLRPAVLANQVTCREYFTSHAIRADIPSPLADDDSFSFSSAGALLLVGVDIALGTIWA